MKKVKTNKIWGYCENSRVYVQVNAQQFIEIEPLGTSFEIAGLALKSYQTWHRRKRNYYGWPLLGAYSSLYTSVPAQIGLVGAAAAIVTIIVKLASDPNQRLIVTQNDWRPIPIYSLKQ